ncbi:hypothetical protein TNCV_3868211 [Trichonephila clavipes]|nr:hypothetical protein TNCV_3868211 [Trichonephila clavipes]
MPGENYLNDGIMPIVKSGGDSIMMWGCFSWFDLGFLVPVVVNMSSELLRSQTNSTIPSNSTHFSYDGRLAVNSYDHLSKTGGNFPKAQGQAIIDTKGGFASY